MPFSQADLIAMQARLNKHKPAPKIVGECEINEATLHDKIISDCKARGWRYVHARMDKRSTIGEGTCDFVIAADHGKVYWIECKSRSNNLTMEQNVFIAWLSKLGHHVAVVRTYQEYLEAVK